MLTLSRLPNGSIYFWDSIQGPNRHPDNLQRFTAVDSNNEEPIISQPSSLTYAEFIKLNPPTVGVNHAKGKYVYSNFGYIYEGKDETLVDPDSQHELSLILNDDQSANLESAHPSCTGDTRATEYCSQHTSPALIHSEEDPDIVSISEFVPAHEMTPEEQDIFYEEYIQEVTDDIDEEGDPRAFLITPLTFLEWAKGAVKGERFQEEKFEPNVSTSLSHILF